MLEVEFRSFPEDDSGDFALSSLPSVFRSLTGWDSSFDEIGAAALEVFSRFDRYGMKAEYHKVTWLTTETTFLGHEIENGYWSLENFMRKGMQEVCRVSTIEGFERVSGVVSYSCRCTKNAELVLVQLREDPRGFKSGKLTEKRIDELNEKFHHVFWQALDNIR